MEFPVKYAKSGDIHIAYRTFGDGPRDIVLVPGTLSHVEIYWELPANEYLLKRLTSFARVIVFDKRGQGLSDRTAEMSLEKRVGDVRAVMDAAGSKRATIYGWSEGGQMCLMFAATYPERTAGLVLYGSYASMKGAPWAVTSDQFGRFLATIEKHWGEGILVRINAPSRLKEEAFVQWFGRLERAAASPSAILALMRANYEIDVRHILPAIRVPALIFHRKGDALVPVEAGRYLAEQIPGAAYVELPGNDHLLQALDHEVLDLLLDQIQEFTTGKRDRARPDEILAAVTSGNIAGSTERGSLTPARTESGPLSDAISELERCRDMLASGAGSAEFDGLLARAEALVAAARGSWQESEAQFIKAVESFRHHKLTWQEAQTFQTWGRTLLGGVERRGLIEKLDSAIELYRRQSAGERRVPTVDTDTAHIHRGKDTFGGRIVEAAAMPEAVFRREGDYWSVSWQGNLVRLKDARGFHHLAYLLANPGRHVLARELALVGAATAKRRSSIEPGGTAATLGDAGALIDAKACEQYRQRIGDLQEELTEADRLNDTCRAAGIRRELESLGDQIAAAVGLGGRARKAASHSERARLMVTKAIKAAIAKIRGSDAALGRHLATSIKTGNFCVYDPGPDRRTPWKL
ncbi:MAG: alpha/beta fold hydrolase [Candidatus Binataceae bacterium]